MASGKLRQSTLRMAVASASCKAGVTEGACGTAAHVHYQGLKAAAVTCTSRGHSPHGHTPHTLDDSADQFVDDVTLYGRGVSEARGFAALQ
jgi:hypothetical protein